MPFGALPNLALPNPMLGLGGLGLPGFPLTSALTKTTDSDGKDKSAGDKDGDGKSDATATSSPHPSFPSFYYNPLMYSPLLAAQGLPGFPFRRVCRHHLPALSTRVLLTVESNRRRTKSSAWRKKLGRKLRITHARRRNCRTTSRAKSRVLCTVNRTITGLIIRLRAKESTTILSQKPKPRTCR